MTDVRAPEGGYTSDSKAHYREAVWDALAPIAKPLLENARAYCLIMPSREGLEIDVAVARGIPPERIVCVDQSAAVIATSLWRKRWPQCRFFASKISQVGEKLRKEGMVIAAANLDLCGNFSDETLAEIDGFLKGAPRFDGFGFALTVMKGREGSVTTRLLERYGANHFEEKRIAGVFAETCMAGMSWRVLAQDQYRGGKMPVAWAAIQHAITLPTDDMAELVSMSSEIAALDQQAIAIWRAKVRHSLQDYEKFCELVRQVEDGTDRVLSYIDTRTRSLVNGHIVANAVANDLSRYHHTWTGENRTARQIAPKTPRGWGIW
jgi:hypothetical protein